MRVEVSHIYLPQSYAWYKIICFEEKVIVISLMLLLAILVLE